MGVIILVTFFLFIHFKAHWIWFILLIVAIFLEIYREEHNHKRIIYRIKSDILLELKQFKR